MPKIIKFCLNSSGSIWANNCKKRMMVVIKLVVVLVQPQFRARLKWIYEQQRAMIYAIYEYIKQQRINLILLLEKTKLCLKQ